MLTEHLTEQLTIVTAAVIFAAIALFFPRLGPFLRQRRIRPPHRAIALVFRLWFAALAVATLLLLFLPAPPHHH